MPGNTGGKSGGPKTFPAGLVDHSPSVGEMAQRLLEYRPTAAALITSAQLLYYRLQVPDMQGANSGHPDP